MSQEGRGRIVPSLPRAGAKVGDLATVLHALGTLWVHGVAVDWKAFHAAEKRRRIPLPAYAFQRKKLWIGPKIGTNWLGETLGQVEDWFYRTSWKSAPLPARFGRRAVARLLVMRSSPTKCAGATRPCSA